MISLAAGPSTPARHPLDPFAPASHFSGPGRARLTTPGLSDFLKLAFLTLLAGFTIRVFHDVQGALKGTSSAGILGPEADFLVIATVLGLEFIALLLGAFRRSFLVNAEGITWGRIWSLRHLPWRDIHTVCLETTSGGLLSPRLSYRIETETAAFHAGADFSLNDRRPVNAVLARHGHPIFDDPNPVSARRRVFLIGGSAMLLGGIFLTLLKSLLPIL